MVGTSLIENYKKTYLNNEYSIADAIEHLSDLSAKEFDRQNAHIIRIIGDEEDYGIQNTFFFGRVIKKDGKWIQANEDEINNHASAEIASIIKISIQFQNDEYIKVRLLATDTVLSVLCAILIKEWFHTIKQSYKLYNNIEIIFNDNVNSPQADFIPSLRTDLKKDKLFNGFNKLIEKILSIAKTENTQTIINITGGYKGFIPILTIIAQLENIPLNYIYEDSEELIKIGKFPAITYAYDFELISAVADILNEGDLKNLDPNSKIIQELLSYSLIFREGENRYLVTQFGKTLVAYVNKAEKRKKDLLGFIFEYMLFYYFTVRKDKDEKYHSPILPPKKKFYFNPETKEIKEAKNPPSGFHEIGDIDLELKNEKDEKVICEVKALSSLLYYDNFYDRQVFPRIKCYEPKEFHIYIYKITFKGKDSSFDDPELMTKLQRIAASIKKDFPNVTFYSRGFYVDMRKKELGIDYTAILQQDFANIKWEILYSQ